MPRASSDLGVTENDVIVRVKRNGDFEELKNDALAELKDSPALQDIEDEVWKEAESATLWESRRVRSCLGAGRVLLQSGTGTLRSVRTHCLA